MSALAAIVIVLVAGSTCSVQAMDCTLGQSKNFIDKIVNSCPLPFESSDKSYCCVDFSSQNNNVYCCTEAEFALKMGVGVLLPVIIVSALVISLILCCISCLCCSCCPWYRRRHRGTVYGKVHTPNVVHVIQTPSNVPTVHTSPPAQDTIISYPTNAAGMSQQPPPPYTNEMYVKQAPYNPNFVQG